MDVLFRLGPASAESVRRELRSPPSNAAVRTILRVLEDKGYVSHVREGPRFVFRTVLDPAEARSSLLRHIVETFFEGSVAATANALVDLGSGEHSAAELNELAALVEATPDKGE